MHTINFIIKHLKEIKEMKEKKNSQFDALLIITNFYSYSVHQAYDALSMNYPQFHDNISPESSRWNVICHLTHGEHDP